MLIYKQIISGKGILGVAFCRGSIRIKILPWRRDRLEHYPERGYTSSASSQVSVNFAISRFAVPIFEKHGVLESITTVSYEFAVLENRVT